MKIRAVSLGNQQRRSRIAASLSLDSELLLFTPYIFILSSLSDEQRRILQHVASQGILRILHDQPEKVIITPGPASNGKTVFSETDGSDPELITALNHIILFLYHRQKSVWRWKKHVLDFSGGPFIMGILNVTPDSFSDGGHYFSVDRAVEHGMRMAESGARIIDIGGESTRPGADPVSLDEELRRVIPVIEGLRKQSGVLISVDTYKSAIAEAALSSGANIVNDISGALFDAKMIDVVRNSGCPLIVMHIKGTPRDMQINPHYKDVSQEVYFHFDARLRELRDHGLSMLAVDPGIGFGKRLQDNLELIRNLEDFTFLGAPIVMGTSRKSFIGQILNKTTDDRLFGTLATVCSSVWHQADIVRVHDVAVVNDALLIIKAIESGIPSESYM